MGLRYSILLIVVFSSVIGFSQQDAMYTQYMFNGLALNPAYAGSQDALSITALAREQWTSIEGAPSTQTISIHAPLTLQRMGVGLQLVNDKIGVSKETSVAASYAYWIPVGEGKFTFGLQVGLGQFKTDFNKLVLDDNTDDQLSGASVSELKPNFGSGLYYYTKKYYIGLSIPRLATNSFGKVDAGNAFKQARHYNLYGGYVFDLSPNVRFKPNVLIKYVQGAPVEMDLNVNFLFVDRLWLGVSWRTLDSFDFLTQFYINDQLSVGYSYDLTTTDWRGHVGGSHELMLNYLFSFEKDKMITPRYFF